MRTFGGHGKNAPISGTDPPTAKDPLKLSDPLSGRPPAAPTAPSAPAPRFINRCGRTGPDSRADGAVQELTDGLMAKMASASPKFFYNALGSRIFEAITALDEYYPTRTEAGIFQAAAGQIAGALADQGLGRPCLIDLGAGNCAKALSLMPVIKPRQYVPVDISADFLRDAAGQVQNGFPMLDIVAVGMDFSAGLVLPGEVQPDQRVYFYPGSSLGNFQPAQALEFLRRMADPAQGKARGLLLGIDLVKDPATLEAAYDDALGVTAAFNKNLLRNVNGLLAADFDVRQWRHVALFNAGQSRIEMHLEALSDLTVRWPGHARQFFKGERIHTESSYKYTTESMTVLLEKAGFRQIRHWTDPDQWFAVFWAAI
ncbi:MAG: L-histidine N(alpha)-methyltransferase [Polaromonas sp.]|nr:L-histidine N(alpha)-methyltransferase [Polaromonas sp.]